MLKIKLGTDEQTTEAPNDEPISEIYKKLSKIGILNKETKQEDLGKEMQKMMDNDKELTDHLENVMLETWLNRVDLNSAIADMR
jgi:hypothetical protein